MVQGDIVYAKDPEHIFYNDVDQERIPGLVKELSGFSYKWASFSYTHVLWDMALTDIHWRL